MSARSFLPSTSGDSISDLRSKLSATTLALHETLDAVMAAFDKHTQELDGLRRALTEAEASLKVTAPQIAEMMKPMPTLPELPRQSAAQPMSPMPAASAKRPPPEPMMTQILWPSKDNVPEAVTPLPAPVPAPMPAARRPEATPIQISAPPPMEPSAAPTTNADMEQATLEELNAALAYAFSQVSNTTSLGKGAVTQMMPAPLPSQAMRFGNASELSGRF